MDLAIKNALPPHVKYLFIVLIVTYIIYSSLIICSKMKRNLKLEELSIIIPIYREEENIEKLWFKIKENINLKKYEVIYVNDHSNDKSEKILKKIKKKNKKINFIIRKNKEKDLSKSCFLGFKKSIYKNILVMDGDFQHDPKYISKFINKYNNSSCDIIVGSRFFFSRKNQGLDFLRSIASVSLIFLINFLLGKKTSDPMSGFFLFKKNIILKSKKKFFKKGYKILLDLIYSENNLRIEDINYLLMFIFKKKLDYVF